MGLVCVNFSFTLKNPLTFDRFFQKEFTFTLVPLTRNRVGIRLDWDDDGVASEVTKPMRIEKHESMDSKLRESFTSYGDHFQEDNIKHMATNIKQLFYKVVCDNYFGGCVIGCMYILSYRTFYEGILKLALGT